MTKLELIEIIAKKAHLTKKAAREAIEALIEEINRGLAKGEKIVISGFGTFKVVKVKDKKGRVPSGPDKGKEIVIKGHKAVRFVVGKPLKRAVK